MNLDIRLTPDGVLTLALSHPPVNALSHSLRAALQHQLERAEQDPDVRAVVITGNDRLFSAGADLQELASGRSFDPPGFQAVTLPFLLGMTKPVVAALSGLALGGGLELALWCHARVAAPEAKLGLPEVTLGLMPGAGGTQLLPRALGLERATSMILAGSVMPAKAFEGTPLVDEYAPREEVLASAQRLALRMAHRGEGSLMSLPHLARLAVEHSQPQGFLAFARAQASARRDFVPSMLTAVDAIALSLKLPALEGLAAEFEMFRAVAGSAQARAIRHGFLSERRCAQVDDLPEGIPVRRIRQAAVVGAGFMGSGIALCLARAGMAVKVYDQRPQALSSAVEALQAQLGTTTRIEAAMTLNDLAQVDLVIEAIVEDMAAKQALFEELDRILVPGAILATNTSTLDIDALASVTRRMPDVVGLHFFGPAPVMRLLEVVRAAATSPEVLATSLDLARRIGKVPVVARVAPGFIGNRIFDAMLSEALELVALGVPPADVDAALERHGWRMGPLRTMDLIGNDVLVKARSADAPRGAGVLLQERLVSEGRLGQKTGAGWYRYTGKGGRKAEPDPALEAWLAPEDRALAGDLDGNARRCMLALINEAARVLGDGVAQRASDIDVTFLLGYGAPRQRGGPMHEAEEWGLANVVQALRGLERETGDRRWSPAPMLLRCASESGCWPT